jgi:hypothetical protein
MVAAQVLRFGPQLLHGCEDENQLRKAAQRAGDGVISRRLSDRLPPPVKDASLVELVQHLPPRIFGRCS